MKDITTAIYPLTPKIKISKEPKYQKSRRRGHRPAPCPGAMAISQAMAMTMGPAPRQSFFPTTFMLRVSLTPWRKRLSVIAGFPLFRPPRANARRVVYLLFVFFLSTDLLPGAILALSNAIPSTQRYFGALLDPSKFKY